MIKIFLYGVVAVISLYILWKCLFAGKKCVESKQLNEENIEENYINKMIEQYGEPVEILSNSVLTNTRQELPVLLYADYLIINKERIDKENIYDITFNNSSNPYVANDYQVVIALKDNERKRISVGNDSDRARYLMQRLAELYKETSQLLSTEANGRFWRKQQIATLSGLRSGGR